MSKKTLIIGSKKKFNQKLSKLLDYKEKITIIDINSCAVLINSDVQFFSSSNLIPIDDSKIYTRSHGENKEFASILYTYLDYFNIPTFDLSNKYASGINTKASQMLRLAIRGLPVPKSFYIEHQEAFNQNISVFKENFQFPVVIKGDGSKGQSVWMIKDLDELLEKIAFLGENRHGCLIQEYIPNNFDIRVMVIGGEIVAAIKRSSSDSFYNNIAHGAKAEVIDLTDSEKAISLKSAEINLLDVAGVDLVRDGSKSLIFEVNKSPSFDGFEEATGLNITQKIAEMITK